MSEYPPDFTDDPTNLPYAFEDTAYWMPGYTYHGKVTHIVKVGMETALCGLFPITDFYGSGSWSEIMKARKMPLCQKCQQQAMGIPTLANKMHRVEA